MFKNVYSVQSQFQAIDLFYDDETGHVKLEINGCTQFISADEYRYHEFAILSGLICCQHEPKRVLILGGGDGLAAREALKFSDKVTLVDIDPEMIAMSTENELMRRLNRNSLNSLNVKRYTKDAVSWCRVCRDNKFDVIFADYPDPTCRSLEPLFSEQHYADLRRILKPGGVAIIQSGGAYMFPLMSCIGGNLKKHFKTCVPAHLSMLQGCQGFWLVGDVLKPDYNRLENIPAVAFDKTMFVRATLWCKDEKKMLKLSS